MRIALVSTSTYAAKPKFYGGEIFIYNLAQGLCELGHDVTLYGAPGSLLPHENCRCRLKYVPGGHGTIGPYEQLAYEWYWNEVMAHDWIIDFQHTHMFAEIAGWYYRDLQKKIFCVPNGV